MCECSSVQPGSADCSEVSAATAAVVVVIVQFWSLQGCREGPGHYSFFSLIILKKDRRG